MFLPATMLPTLCGYTLLFNRPTNRREHRRRLQFVAGAFDEFLARERIDVFATVNHEDRGVQFASTARGSLLIDSDSRGLFVVALPRNDSDGRIACALVKAGHAAKMSACVRYDEADVVRAGDLDIVAKSKLDEVSAVPRPAIEGTSLHIAGERHDLPRTVEALVAERCRLRAENRRHAAAGTLGEWKRQKAVERAALLSGLASRSLAGCA